MASALAAVLSEQPRLPLVVSSKGVARVLGRLIEGASRPPAGNTEVLAFTLPPGLLAALRARP